MKKILFSIMTIVFAMIYYSCSDASAIVPAKSDKKVLITGRPIKEAGVVKKRFYDEKILPKIEIVLEKLTNDDVRYDWQDYTSCNVGLFAQLCTNSSPKEIAEKFETEYADYLKFAKDRKLKYQHSWKQVISYYCGITGKPIKGIVNDLLNAGFKKEDVSHLEFLDDPYILSLSKIETKENWFTDKSNLIKYLQTWADILKVQ